MAYDYLNRFCRPLPVQRHRAESEFLEALHNISFAKTVSVYKPFDLLIDDEGRVGGKYVITAHALALLCDLLAPGLGQLVRHLIRERKTTPAVEVLNSVVSAELDTLRDYYRMLFAPIGSEQVLFDVREADLPAVEIFNLYQQCHAGLPGLSFSHGVIYYPSAYVTFIDPLTRLDFGETQFYDGVLLRLARGRGPLYRASAAVCPVLHWSGADGRSYRATSCAASWFPVADPEIPVLSQAKVSPYSAAYAHQAFQNSANYTLAQVLSQWQPARNNHLRRQIVRMQALAKGLAEQQNSKATGMHFFLAYARELDYADAERNYKMVSELAPSLWSFFTKTEVENVKGSFPRKR